MSTFSGALSASPIVLSPGDSATFGATPPGAVGPTFRIATFGLSSVDDALIKAVLKITHGRSRAAWAEADVAQAHAVIVNETDLRAAEQAGVLDGRVRILLRKGAPTAARTDTTVLTPPITVLNMLAALDFASDQSVNVFAPPPTAQKVDATLADLVTRIAGRDSGSVLIQSDGIGALTVDFATRRYRTDFPRTQLTQALGGERFRLTDSTTTLTVAESRTLNELFWSAGLEAQRTPALQKSTTLSLRRWPEFPRLPHLVEHIQLSGLMNGRETTLAQLIAESQLPPATVESFARACVVCGYAQVVPKSNVQLLSSVVAARFARGGLLDRLRKRLGF